MDRNRPDSKEISKSSAGKTGESSRAEVPGPSGREAKRRCGDVQSTGFDTSQEEEEEAGGGSSSSLQSQLMLSQPLTDTQASVLDAASVEVLSSPLLDDPSPLPGSNALDALDGWSLGSNMFFSDTGSGGGFLESQASSGATQVECGVAPPPLPRRLGKELSSSGKGKGSGKATTSGKARLSPPVLLPPVSVSAKKYKRRKSDELFAVLDAVRGASTSRSSSLRMSDDRFLGGNDEDDEEEMVLESAPDNGTSRNVKSTEKTVENDLTRVVDAFVLSPNVGTDAGESSPDSSVADLFTDSDNMVLKSDSQSSLTAEFDPDSPEREIITANSKRREQWLRRKKKGAEALVFEEKQQENRRDRSPDSDSENHGNEKSMGKNPEKNQDSSKTANDNSKQTEKSSDQKQGKSCENNNKSAGKTAQNDDKSKQNSNKKQEKRFEKNNSNSAGKSAKKVGKSKQRNNKKQKKSGAKDNKKTGSKASQKFTPSPHISQTSSTKDENPIVKTHNDVIELKSSSQSSGSEFSMNVKHMKSNEQSHVANTTKSIENFSTSGRLSLKRGAGTLTSGKKIHDGNGKSIVDSLPSAVVEDTMDGDDTGSSVEGGKKDGRGGKAKGCSTRKNSPPVEEDKGEIKRRRGRRIEETILPALPDKPTLGTSGGRRMVEKTQTDDGRTKGADGSTASDDGRSLDDGKTPIDRKTGCTTVDDGKTPVDHKTLDDRKTQDDGKTQDDSKTQDDGKTRDDGKTVDAGKTKDDGRSRSPSLFEYESDSMLAPSALVIHARKPKRPADKKILGRSEHGETSSAEKSRPGGSQLQDSNLSQIKSLRKTTTHHQSVSSKSVLTDSGIAATTPASFTLASRPGLAKHLTTSTPLEQYRSMVGLGNPKQKKGVKKGKRPREDSGNDSDFVLESNISMPSPVWPVPRVRAHGRGQIGGQCEPIVTNPKKCRAGKIGKGAVSETQPEDVVMGRNAAKRRKLADLNELLPGNEVNLKKMKKKDAVETPPVTATQIIGTTDVKVLGPQRKKPDGRDPVLNAAKARQMNIEERLLQELDDIDQNYSLIIDDD